MLRRPSLARGGGGGSGASDGDGRFGLRGVGSEKIVRGRGGGFTCTGDRAGMSKRPVDDDRGIKTGGQGLGVRPHVATSPLARER